LIWILAQTRHTNL